MQPTLADLKFQPSIKPSDINTSGHFYGVFGHAETEIAARWIVRFFQSNGNEWRNFTRKEIQSWARENGLGKETLFFFSDLAHSCVWLNRTDYSHRITFEEQVSVTMEFIDRLYQLYPANNNV